LSSSFINSSFPTSSDIGFLQSWCTTMLSAARQPSKFLFHITGIEFSEVWLLLQVLPVSLRVPPHQTNLP
jgi:hypothetical protein